MVDEIMKSGEEVNFAMIGLGSSNDISKEIHADTLEKACLALQAGKRTRIDRSNPSLSRRMEKFSVAPGRRRPSTQFNSRLFPRL